MSSGRDSAVISVICDAEGVVVYQSPPRAPAAAVTGGANGSGDEWTSGERLAPDVGRPLIKTFPFAHLDCDHRELQQVLRKTASTGVADRVRVWVRVDEHQLIRAELITMPLLDESGQTKHVLVRTEPTQAAGRAARVGRRNDAPAEPTEKPVRLEGGAAAAPPPADLLTLPLDVPLLRVERAGGTVVAANEALATLLGRPREQCASLPVSELVHPQDRRRLTETLASMRTDPPAGERPLELRLRAAGDREVLARLSVTADPVSGDGTTALVLIRDVSAEVQARTLEQRAAEAAAESERVRELLNKYERLFDHAPIGLSISEDGTTVRTNLVFDQHAADSAAWIDALTHRAASTKGVAESSTTRQTISSFWLGDQRSRLIGTVIAPAPKPATAIEHRWTAALNAMEAGGRVATLLLQPDGSLQVLGEAARSLVGPADPPTVERLLAPESLGEFRSLCATARSSNGATTARLLLNGQRSCHMTCAACEDGSVLLLVEDVSDMVRRIDELRDQVRSLSEQADELRVRLRTADPNEITRLRETTSERGEQLALMLRSTNAGTFTWNVDDGQVEADERACALLTCGSTSPTPVSLLQAAQPEERDAFERALFDAMSSEGSARIDHVCHVGDARRPVRIVGHVVFEDREGSRDPARLVATVFDLEGDRQAQARIAELDRLVRLRTAELNAIMECAPTAIRIRSDGVIRHNTHAARLFGDHVAFMFGPDGVGPARIRATDADGAAVAAELLPPAIAMGGQADINTLNLDRDDEEGSRHIESSAAPIRLDGEIVGAVAVDQDLTDIRRLEASLRQRELEIAGVFQNTGVGVAYLDHRGTILDVNPQFSVLMGLARGDLLDRTLHDMTGDAEDRATLTGQIEAVLSGELASCSSELRLVRRDGETRWTQVTIAPRHDEEGDRSVIALIQDIDELRRLREDLARSTRTLELLRERYELMSDTIEEAFVLLDSGGRLIEANDAARRLLGVGETPIAGGGPFDHLTLRVPETDALVTDRLPWVRPLRGKPTRGECRVTRGDRSASEVLYIHFNGSPAPGGNVVVTARDVTARHALQDELQTAHARVVEAHTLLQQRTNQLEGNFSSAVHQLGAAVGTASPIARSLAGDPRLSPEVRDALGRISDAFRLHEQLVHHYADATALPTAVTRDEVDVHALVLEAVRHVAERFNVGGRINHQLEASQSTCRVDAALVQHALWSVIAHAASQSSRAATTIESDNVIRADGVRRLHLSVSWPGNRADTAELRLSRALIEASGGTLTIEADEGQQTLATIAFDTSEPAPEPSGRGAKSKPVRVLLVEDHESTARVLGRQLSRLNCVVEHARDLPTAEAALAGGSPTFDLIICDLTLPGGSPREFVAKMKGKRKVPTIALRSSSADDGEALKSAGFVEALTKPIDLNALAAAIGRITGR